MVAPRGIVAASLASLFAVSLTKEGMNGGDSIKALVFLTIMMTVFFQGLTAGWVASLLNLRLVDQIDQDSLQATTDDVNSQKDVDKNSLTSELIES